MLYARLALTALALASVHAAPMGAQEKTVGTMSVDELSTKIATVAVVVVNGSIKLALSSAVVKYLQGSPPERYLTVCCGS